MKESMWGYWIVVLGVSIMSVMVLLQNYTTTNEQDYYLIKSVLEASMNEAVDYGYYRDKGQLKMNREKFVENFVRRFSETVNINKNYKLDFYQIYEEPPAASVRITTATNDTNYGMGNGQVAANDTADISNSLTGILYTNANYQYRPTN